MAAVLDTALRHVGYACGWILGDEGPRARSLVRVRDEHDVEFEMPRLCVLLRM